jgi:hypothetical protein
MYGSGEEWSGSKTQYIKSTTVITMPPVGWWMGADAYIRRPRIDSVMAYSEGRVVASASPRQERSRTGERRFGSTSEAVL